MRVLLKGMGHTPGGGGWGVLLYFVFVFFLDNTIGGTFIHKLYISYMGMCCCEGYGFQAV